MPTQSAYIELPSGQRIPLYVQDLQLSDPSRLHLSHRMSRSEWADPATSPGSREALFAATHDADRRRPKALASVPTSRPPLAQVYLNDGKRDVAFAPVVLTPLGPNKSELTLFNPDPEAPVHVFLRGSQDRVTGSVNVTEADVTLFPLAPSASSMQTIACAALRTRHMIRAAIGERVQYDDHQACAALSDHAAVHVENGHGTDDSHYLNALSIAFSIETDGRQHFMHTDVGHRLLHSPAGPAQTIAASPDDWAYHVAQRAHIGMCVVQSKGAPHRCRCAEQHVGDYIDRAHALDQRLIEGWLKDVYTNITQGVKASVRKLLPSKETIATLKALNGTAVSGVKKVAGSKTAQEVVLAALGNQGDASRAQVFAKALLGDAGLDETAAGTALIENADQVTAALKSAWGKMRGLPLSEIKEFSEGLTKEFDHEAIRGGLRAVMSQAAKAPALFEKYGPQLVAAGKKVVEMGTKAAPVIVATGKQAAEVGGSALSAITNLVSK